MKLIEAEKLAKELIARHSPHYTFKWTNAKRQFGNCLYSKTTIGLSRILTEMNNEEQVRDIILHELAHSQAPRRSGHNRWWKKIAKEIGCKPERCYGSEVDRPKTTYIGTCPKCGIAIERFKKRDIACGKCCNQYNYGKFSNDYKFVWKMNE